MGEYAEAALQWAMRHQGRVRLPDPNRKPEQQCPHCPKLCFSRDGLADHIKRKHGDHDHA